MGVVYEAEQEQPRRTVALKVIKPGMTSPELLRRFEQESLALARLQHPAIAQIHEAGTADTGFGPQPYFAMELIRGQSLRDYVQEHDLNTRQRLQLMVRICEGVQHAHQRGLIHRDLKPGNILVDETGQPKILDFGVVRVTDGDVETTRQTHLGQLVGTLAYMSPEQALRDPLEVDTRSDVYALGVILYELLAGRLPYDLSRKPHEAARTIQEEDPTPLSSISRVYRGDIETIVVKALEKDKVRRYASASGLAADIQRYLNDEPIAARSPSATYQLQKFSRRHRGLVAGAGAVFVVLIAGITVSTWEATRARRAEQAAIDERNRANTESATAKAVNDFLQNDLLAQASANNQAGPATRPDPDLKVRTALDRASASIEGKFAKQPLVEASILQTIGNTYADLGLYRDAELQLERALDLRRRVLGERHPDTLMSMNNLASLYMNQGELARAKPLFTELLDARRRVLGEEHPDTARTMNNLAMLYEYQGEYKLAEPLYTKALEIKRRVLGEDHPSTLTGMLNLGTLYGREGRYAQSEPLYIKVLEVRRRVLGEEHPDTLMSTYSLGALYAAVGKYAQAQSLYAKAIELMRRVLGEEHPDTLHAMWGLGNVYRSEGKYAEAKQLLIKTLEFQRRVLGERNGQTLVTMRELALLYRDEGDDAKAEPLLVNTLELQRRVLGGQHPDTRESINELAFLFLKQRKYGPAEALLSKALDSQQKSKYDSWDQSLSQSLLGAAFAGQKKYAQGEALLLSGYQGMLELRNTVPASDRAHLERAGEWIVQLYRNWGRLEQAAEWREKLNATKRSGSAGRH
jgi:serine/threonine protein kinase